MAIGTPAKRRCPAITDFMTGNAMPNRLKNIDVQWISLVRNPANGLPLVLKDANAKPFCVLKTDDERRMVYGIVYAPDRVDSQGDFADRFEIERAAHQFLKAQRTAQVDANHEFEALPGAYVAESWIIRGDDGWLSDSLPYAWAVGIKIEDEALWEAVKAGEWAGLSLAGAAEREPAGEAPAPESAPDAPAEPPAAEAGVTVSKAEFDALVRAVEVLAASLAEPPPTAVLETLEKTANGDEAVTALQMRLDEILRVQTQLADRLMAVEKQRLSADHAPPAPPKNWLREVL